MFRLYNFELEKVNYVTMNNWVKTKDVIPLKIISIFVAISNKDYNNGFSSIFVLE